LLKKNAMSCGIRGVKYVDKVIENNLIFVGITKK
jgi:hypothetical protein